ncbi:unnamed protein product [Caenorhabditis auriculariae]|uniref:Uncharacterized protein n=1 Tax=Caenorhabditis auriculariae TaxID=2777116 RepID=A0A8S1GY62_9PELO|nr:unnamed protein product [Caenorhabditis auriculariae]
MQNPAFFQAAETFKKIRAPFFQRQSLVNEFESFVSFEKHCYSIWAMYQQATVGNINVPILQLTFESKTTWMTNMEVGCGRGYMETKRITTEEAEKEFVRLVNNLEKNLETLKNEWRKTCSNEDGYGGSQPN